MPWQATVGRHGTLGTPAVDHDLDLRVADDRNSSRTIGGPDKTCRNKRLSVRLSGRHVSWIVWCRCGTTQQPETPQQRMAGRGGGLRDNMQHRRRARDRSR